MKEWFLMRVQQPIQSMRKIKYENILGSRVVFKMVIK